MAKLFVEKHFDRVALCARNAERLSSEKVEVENAAKKAGKVAEVFTFPTDLSNLESLSKSCKDIEKLGPLGCVYHNAARIKPTQPLTTSIEEIHEDFKVRRPEPLTTGR